MHILPVIFSVTVQNIPSICFFIPFQYPSLGITCYSALQSTSESLLWLSFSLSSCHWFRWNTHGLRFRAAYQKIFAGNGIQYHIPNETEFAAWGLSPVQCRPQGSYVIGLVGFPCQKPG